MKPTWQQLRSVDGPNCRCLTCGKEFTFLADGHFNMRFIKCPTCNQQVWVPRCPNGCSSFDASEEREAGGYYFE